MAGAHHQWQERTIATAHATNRKSKWHGRKATKGKTMWAADSKLL